MEDEHNLTIQERANRAGENAKHVFGYHGQESATDSCGKLAESILDLVELVTELADQNDDLQRRLNKLERS